MLKRIKQHGYKLVIQLFLLSISFVITAETSFASPSVEGIQVYQTNVHSSPEHKQNLVDDITRYRNADNLWDALREEFVLQHYENTPAVQEKIEWFMNNQDYLLRSASRAAPYLYYILQQVRKRHLPAELVLLPIIESGYNPFAISNVGATGIWQMMPGTASGLGIKRDLWYDGRRDVIASTRGALNYLAYLQSFFEGNWLLAIAAYNTGEGNVLAAIRRNIRDGRDTDFWSLPLAQQTKDYVPSLLALATIISHPDQYPVYFPPVRNAPYLGQVDVGSAMNLKYASQLAGISYQKMIQLNPGFNRPATSSKVPYKIVLPIENVAQFTENLARTPMTPTIHWLHYRVKTGDTLASVSRKFNTTPTDIRKLNHLTKTNFRRGLNLLIPTNAEMMADNDDDDSDRPTLAENRERKEMPRAEPIVVATRSYREEKPVRQVELNLENSNGKYTLQPGDTVYVVRARDTYESIAKHFHITTHTLKAANQFAGKKVKPGKNLIIPTHMIANNVEDEPVTNKKLQPGDTIYMVRRGDTVEKIAQRFHTSPSAIRLTNLIDNSSLAEGEKLVIPTHLRG